MDCSDDTPALILDDDAKLIAAPLDPEGIVAAPLESLIIYNILIF